VYTYLLGVRVVLRVELEAVVKIKLLASAED
jgi:hypothetical protein